MTTITMTKKKTNIDMAKALKETEARVMAMIKKRAEELRNDPVFRKKLRESIKCLTTPTTKESEKKEKLLTKPKEKVV